MESIYEVSFFVSLIEIAKNEDGIPKLGIKHDFFFILYYHKTLNAGN